MRATLNNFLQKHLHQTEKLMIYEDEKLTTEGYISSLKLGRKSWTGNSPKLSRAQAREDACGKALDQFVLFHTESALRTFLGIEQRPINAGIEWARNLIPGIAARVVNLPQVPEDAELRNLTQMIKQKSAKMYTYINEIENIMKCLKIIDS